LYSSRQCFENNINLTGANEFIDAIDFTVTGLVHRCWVNYFLLSAQTALSGNSKIFRDNQVIETIVGHPQIETVQVKPGRMGTLVRICAINFNTRFETGRWIA